ncbi:MULTISPECIES: membrane protein insertase YidC [unclassified Granulicatella]|uniref:membrane protein insertase YidC n=1 Tax=unclassified Granulicatella TaxID=2630493 RepID=UPI0010749BB5|nr:MULTISPECIES: membrane protein insertase YidC [unclassified Granulicatella]MBF0781012.1 membrane protein insertase YidC [Granulicatella sp. 19428wC4_WM01]TFU92584.1 membrane protein insertase YidC [Granulicatella sp. WM01]
MNKIKKAMILLFMTFMLTACGNVQEGEFNLWQSVIDLLSGSIKYLANAFNGNYAVGIILFTIITRILLLPILQYQSKISRKTAELQPEMKRLREQYSARDRETQMQLQEAIKELNAKHGVNQWAGCLPMLIQMPIMIALYQAVGATKEIHEGHFFWVELGKADPYFILPILAAFFTWLNSYLILQGQPKNAQQMKFLQLYFMPGMIFFFSISVNSALALYWLVGNIFAVVQTLILNNPFKLRQEREDKLRAEKAKKRAIKRAIKEATSKK